ncbi:hypothetical protein K7X08_019974 [Anisodus acutangulus]|uniref:Uncharacterized protein n=1 Tax=Anisodus acutangulus TaxID=402998 RepID=A0A9Q1RR53_9SOLA|nr:hypothetical protein K7X08_019974 [Anisodus acutangulus]
MNEACDAPLAIEYVPCVPLNGGGGVAFVKQGGTIKEASRNNDRATKKRMEQKAATINRDGGKGKGMSKGKGKKVQQENQGKCISGHASRPYKSPRMVGVGLLVTDDDFTPLNPGMSTRRVVDTGTRAPRRSDVVTGILAAHHKEDSNERGNKPLPIVYLNNLGMKKESKQGLELLLTIKAKAVHLVS